MAIIAKNILSLNHEEAMDFFMKSEQYHGFELPEYFTFDEVLKYVRETVGNAPKAEDWESVDLGDEAEPAKTKAIFSELKTYNPPKYIPGGSIRALSAVCTQIALENVGCSHYALRIISRMIDSLKDMDEKRTIVDLVYKNLCEQHNYDYNQLWLQNMTYTQDKKQGISPYTLRLCQLVAGKTVEPLWNNNWLKPELATSLPYDSVVDGETLKKVTPVITFRETRMYNEIEY